MKEGEKQIQNISKIISIAIPLLIILLGVAIIFPFLKYMAFGAILVISLYPLYDRLNKKIKRPTLSSIIMIILTILIIFLPLSYASIVIINEASETYEDLLFSLNFDIIDSVAKKIFQGDFNIDAFLATKLVSYRDGIIEEIPNILSSATNIIINMVIMLFLMFYLFRDGDKIYKRFYDSVKIDDDAKRQFFTKIKGMSKAILNGQLVVAIIQGIIGGIGFWIFGVDAPILWGVVMAILSLLPLFGAALVWFPASIILMGKGHVGMGIGLLLYGGIIVSQIDNVIRPIFVGKKGNIHPFLVFVGVLGGISVFGVLGVLLGPLVLGISWAMAEFYIEYSRKLAKNKKASAES